MRTIAPTSCPPHRTSHSSSHRTSHHPPSRSIAAAVAAGLSVALLALAAACGDAAPAQGLPIGSPCTATPQCGSDPKFYCDRDHPGGYCKKDCTRDADCPGGSVCAFEGPLGACHKSCNAVADCRAGYVCKQASTDPAMPVSHAICDTSDVATDDGGAGDDGGADGGMQADGSGAGDGGSDAAPAGG